VDLVLQRSGRLHRHGGRTRPAAVAKPRLLLIQPGVKDDRPDFGKSEFVYGRYVLLRSWEVLRGKPTLNVPQEIEPLVEAAYVGREETDLDYVAAKQLDTEEREELQQKANGILAPSPSMKRNFWTCWNAGLGEDEDPTTHPSRQIATRDVRPTVQLVVAYVKDGREFLDASCHELMTVDQVLTSAHLGHTKAILENAVAVSNAGCFRHYARQNPPKGWAQNGLLKHYRLVRVGLDGTSLTPDEYPLTVSEEIGIRFPREPMDA
jgi:CRISPR-associated endonuclease/helicase Cas3